MLSDSNAIKYDFSLILNSSFLRVNEKSICGLLLL